MKTELMNHFSGWCLDFASHPENYYLVLSDDMDSFYSCKYLKKRFNAEIGGYYAFGKGLFLTEKAKKENRNLIYVDKLATYNDLEDPNIIHVDQVLYIPEEAKLKLVEANDYSLQYKMLDWRINHPGEPYPFEVPEKECKLVLKP